MAVSDQQLAYKEAINRGAMAFFSEKYGDVVRMVSIGGPDSAPISMELCGGVHVRQTGDIGSALIASESAVSAGVRRIEILTGLGALEHARAQSRQLGDVAQIVNAAGGDVVEQARRLSEQLKEAQKQLEAARRELARARFGAALASVTNLGGGAALIAQVQADSNDQMREMSDWFRERHASGIAVLGALINDKPALLVTVSPDLNKKGVNAGALIKEIAAIVGGSGGGRPALAQAGGKDAGALGAALDKARALAQAALDIPPGAAGA